MLSHKAHRVYAKFHERKTHEVLAFRAKKIKENQGLSEPHQAGVGIYGLPFILSQNSTVSATISEPCTAQYGGFASPYFFSRIKPCLIHGVLHRTATPSESKKRGVSRTFREIRIGAFTQAKVVCSRQFAKISVNDTSKHKTCQGNMHCLPLARQAQ